MVWSDPRSATTFWSALKHSLHHHDIGDEAQMLGTPVIATDHAAMSEPVWHVVTGYRCRTLRCFVATAKQVHLLDRSVIAKRVRETYSCIFFNITMSTTIKMFSNLMGCLRVEPSRQRSGSHFGSKVFLPAGGGVRSARCLHD
jgi:hypothetical protein